MTDTTHSATDDPLRLENCPGCGYALNGSPDEGLCPECGREYDQQVIVLHGWSRGLTSNIATARPWEAAAIVGGWVFYLWYIFRPGSHAGWYDPWTYVVIGYGVYYGWALWRRWSSYMPGLVQVRLNSDGICQLAADRAALAPAVVPWSKVRGVTLEERGDGLAWLRIKAPVTTWVRTNHFPVDALVKCTPAQVRALHERIEQWRQPAAPVAGTGATTAN